MENLVIPSLSHAGVARMERQVVVDAVVSGDVSAFHFWKISEAIENVPKNVCVTALVAAIKGNNGT